MYGSKDVFDKLDELKISYQVAFHPEALTMEEADRYIEGWEGVRTKTLFLCNKKKNKFYLVALEETKRLDLKKLESMLLVKGLRFASEEMIEERTGLSIGMVSVFGVINDKDNSIRVILDKEMRQKGKITFYANDPGKTVFIEFDDVVYFVKNAGNEIVVEKL